MAIPRVNRQARQPQYPVSVDTANPITRGLVRALVCEASGIRDLMLGTGISVTGTYIPQATESGYGRRNNTINRANYTTVDARTETVSAITIVWAGVVHRIGGSTYPFFRNQQTIIQATGATGPLWSARFGVASTVNSTTPVKVGSPTTYVYRKDGAIGSLFVDGVPALLNITGGTGAHAAAHGIDGNVGFAQSNDITTNVMLIYDRPLSDAESRSLSINPWQVFMPVQRRIYFDAAESGGDIVLTGANAAQLNTSTAGSVTQSHVLSGASANQPNTTTNGSIVQTHVLTGASCSQANTATAGAITQTGDLSGANCAQVNTSSAGAISQIHVLAGASCDQSNASTSGAIIVTNATVLTGANCAQPNTANSGAIGQTHVLVGSPVAIDNIATSSAIVQQHILAGSNCKQENTTTSGGINQAVLPSQFVAIVHAGVFSASVPVGDFSATVPAGNYRASI